MGSMVIFHYNAKALKDEQIMNVMMPFRIPATERSNFFRTLMLDGHYQPAYVIESNDLDVAFDCGNGYPPAGINVIELPTSHKSTSVGDIVVVDGAKLMVVMPMGFEEI